MSDEYLKMTKEEYIQKAENDDDFIPGWEAIDDEFERLYPGVEPAHYGTLFATRAMLGGNEYLDGFSMYDTGKGYYHIVSYGMTELYSNPDAFGKKYSRWGYEMTMKLKETTPDKCLWVTNMMSNLARYTYRSRKYFRNRDFVVGNGTPIHTGTDSVITGLIIVNDTSARTLQTLHGEVEFLQLVGVTTQEINAIRADYSNLQKLLDLMKKDNPELITDMDRTKSYL